VIDAFERLDVGKKISELDRCYRAKYFGFMDGNLWTGPANTVNFPNGIRMFTTVREL
jgi:hypothetical protein